LLFAVCVLGPSGSAAPGKAKAPGPTAPDAGVSPQEMAGLSKRFHDEIWPLLARNCTGCHTASNPSQLHFASSADDSFKALIADGHLDPASATSLLARVTTPDPATHMPPKPAASWSEAEIDTLRRFCNDVTRNRTQGADHLDESFPPALLAPYRGKPISGGGDNTFLTYYQLRNKIRTLFNTSWERDGKDLFEENLAQFGGADFERSFNESNHPTATFLSGLDALSADVAAHAYLTATGPFAGRPDSLPSPLSAPTPSPAYRQQIDRLYRRLLFRDPSPQEMTQSYSLIRSIWQAQKALAEQSYTLRFALTARDEHNLTTTREVGLDVLNDGYGLGQTLVNENDASSLDASGKVAQAVLNGPYTLRADDPGQKVTINNAGTHGNVVISGVQIRGPLPSGPTRVISIKDPGVELQGAWRLSSDDGIDCYEDDNQNKGASSLVIPLFVKADGSYELTLRWRKRTGERKTRRGRRVFAGDYADNLLVEVQSHDPHRLAIPPVPPIPPKGEADFTVDESDDTVSFRQLETAFRFGPGDGVEISNAGTHQHVVADAVRFDPVAASGPSLATASAAPSPRAFMVPAKDADGQDQWKDFKKSEYTFYKPTGPRVVSDLADAATKGKLHLLYRPETAGAKWNPNAYYRVALGYPGEVRNDTDVPILVHARESAPILRISGPARAHVGAAVTLDATGSYNLQGTPLLFTWRQIGGARVQITNPHSPRLTFTAPALSAQQAGWEGLCRALMKHPDFLFTRPLSLAGLHDPATRRRLQLVKIAQDLVGRPPTPAEVAKVDAGAPLTALVNAYLASDEFADFYYRRIRLYLESHGTVSDDEPARLWSWIALNDRPFKEILTADYTVDPDWKRQPRPVACGKSGVLTMKGFISGKPGLPHFNYAAQVAEKFLGYVFVVPLEIVKIRNGLTAASTTSPGSVCYSCHQVLTPLAYQRSRYTDDGAYHEKDKQGQPIDDTDHGVVPSYPFKGEGLAAFAQQAVNKERFIRTIIQTHFVFYFGREMRYDRDERALYKRLWDTEQANHFNIKGLIRALVLSPEYLNGKPALPQPHGPHELAQN
jgi:hypothetical protein